ncbi:MAG TPA: alpha/beta fold hydrolase [Planctomycetaceae bacterium]|nr:alpha/beta fold hydrolase [Planctomycetaceae bacterium]
MSTPLSTLTRCCVVMVASAALWIGASPRLIADEVSPETKKPIDGIWQGVMKVGAIELRLIVRIENDGKGGLKAVIDSPDQGAKGIPVDSVTLEGDALKIESKKIKAVFEGKLSDDRTVSKGEWKQGGSAFPLQLKRLDKEPDLSRPQEPKKPYPYVEEEVRYENTAAKITLAGTLTLPKSNGPVPAVLLITGSGAQDRDESLLGHKPFLVLADHLTRRGMAVLRVDDRGVGGSTGETSSSTTDDFTGDVLTGVAYLKGRKEINPRQIGLIGHSEGGLVAPLAASRSSDVAFIVMMAGTGVSGEEIIYHQGALIAKAMGASDLALAAARTGQERIFKIVKEETDLAKAEEEIRKAVAEQVAADTSTKPEAKKALEAQADAQVKTILTPWYRFFLKYDPVPALRKVVCPVLAINGEKDLQVDPKQNLPPIEQALKEGGNRDYTVKLLAGLNHLFQHAQTGSPAEYGKIDETIAPEALRLMADWIVERTAGRQP